MKSIIVTSYFSDSCACKNVGKQLQCNVVANVSICICRLASNNIADSIIETELRNWEWNSPYLCPAGHKTQWRNPVALLYVPSGHTSGVSIPTLGHLKPASHSLQSLCPFMSEYVPLAHSTYVDNPSVGQWAPLGHEWHWMLPAAANVPAEHLTGFALSSQLKHWGYILDQSFTPMIITIIAGVPGESLKWLLINYQILLPNFLVFSCEWLGEFDIASKVT